MSSLEMVQAQLKVVDHYTDFDAHTARLEDVDRDVQAIDLSIKNLVDLRNDIGEIDQWDYALVSRGRACPNTQTAKVVKALAETCGQIARKLLAKAEPFVQKGHRIERLSRLREIATTPLAGLLLPEILAGAEALSSSDGSITETDVESDFDAARRRLANCQPK